MHHLIVDGGLTLPAMNVRNAASNPREYARNDPADPGSRNGIQSPKEDLP
jgi:hypothetical protein